MSVFCWCWYCNCSHFHYLKTPKQYISWCYLDVKHSSLVCVCVCVCVCVWGGMATGRWHHTETEDLSFISGWCHKGWSILGSPLIGDFDKMRPGRLANPPCQKDGQHQWLDIGWAPGMSLTWTGLLITSDNSGPWASPALDLMTWQVIVALNFKFEGDSLRSRRYI
jgi:hypothetical protein